ncbi:flavodoxin [Psychromonas antarctica]|uniref:flavodoxin n=1 Tax=Psychromonas antarctica TaxID=67573 RepID=UPI001EE85002|nr:flavodoxin [Psychromonas antarctica]MCG6200832.1 flavodoxin [Psychromonas antarctica]
MAKTGIIFATDTGKTRKIAKQIYQILDSEDVAKPININRCSVADLLEFDNLIIGTPTLGEGALPGLSVDCEGESWEEIVGSLEEADFSGKTIALFGLGDQEGYPDEFVDALGELYDIFSTAGATFIGRWPNKGYQFNSSTALDGDQFVGLVLDQDNQASLTDSRLSEWINIIKPQLGL